MADFALCSGLECPIKDSCRRYIFEPNPYYQDYIRPAYRDGSCTSYSEVDKSVLDSMNYRDKNMTEIHMMMKKEICDFLTSKDENKELSIDPEVSFQTNIVRWKSVIRSMNLNGKVVSVHKDHHHLYAKRENHTEHLERVERDRSNYWKNVCQIRERQYQKGLKHYGCTLEENTDLTDLEKLEYLEEELIDGLMYIEKLKDRLLDT